MLPSIAASLSSASETKWGRHTLRPAPPIVKRVSSELGPNMTPTQYYDSPSTGGSWWDETDSTSAASASRIFFRLKEKEALAKRSHLKSPSLKNTADFDRRVNANTLFQEKMLEAMRLQEAERERARAEAERRDKLRTEEKPAAPDPRPDTTMYKKKSVRDIVSTWSNTAKLASAVKVKKQEESYMLKRLAHSAGSRGGD